MLGCILFIFKIPLVFFCCYRLNTATPPEDALSAIWYLLLLFLFSHFHCHLVQCTEIRVSKVEEPNPYLPSLAGHRKIYCVLRDAWRQRYHLHYLHTLNSLYS